MLLDKVTVDFCAIHLVMFFKRSKSLRVLRPSYITAKRNTTITAPTISEKKEHKIKQHSIVSFTMHLKKFFLLNFLL